MDKEWLAPIVAKVKEAMETGAPVAHVRLDDEASLALGQAVAADQEAAMAALNAAFGDLGADHVTCKRVEINAKTVAPPGRITMGFGLQHNN